MRKGHHKVKYLRLTLVVADKRAAVVLDDGGQGSRGPAAAGHPAGELVVPHAVVAYKNMSTPSSRVEQ